LFRNGIGNTILKPGTTIGIAGAVLALAGTAAVQPVSGSKHVKASLLAEPESVAPGQRFWVGIRLQMEQGWHTYWKNPADSGLPTRMSWRLPAGFAAGPILWPYPTRLAAPPLMSYGYEGEVLLPVEISLPSSLVTGSDARLEGRVDWLECKEACIAGKAEIAVTLPVRAAPRPAPETAALFAEARRRLPKQAGTWVVDAKAAPSMIALTFRAPRGEAPGEAYFFAAQPLVIDYAAPQPLRDVEGGHRLELAPAANAQKPLTRLVGVLLTEGRAGRVALDVDVPVARTAK
jgi:DsbC/DsbD-like thiol-disulfide interchange protein